MNISLFFETILILFAILASNGIIYSLTLFKLNKQNSSKNISVITNSSEKDGLALTALIASNHIRLTSSESSSSQSLSVTSSESSSSQSLSVTSSESSSSQDIFDNDNWIDSAINLPQDILDIISWTDSEIWAEIHTENSNLLSTNEENLHSNVDVFEDFSALDSLTILDSQSFEQWREIAMDFSALPVNSPAGVLQTFKFEELNILYSQDIIQYAITQTELRLIIEHFPAMSLFDPDINHLILTIMSYYHL
uniref:Uncharacterized protein n=1 Tax=Lactarius hatsudake TaxID=416442 RepID=A0A2Z4M8T4_9AGAM|nr:hypothetical protein [Lactarius hatsudake]AWX52900.1 hypothetical protein [Lactarius hatsudake]